MFKISSLGDCDLIVFTGAPASGKSRICKIIQKQENYTVLNSSISEMQSNITAFNVLHCNNRLIIDRCSPTIAVRARYLAIARRLNKSIGLLYVETNKNQTIDSITRDLYKTKIDAHESSRQAKMIANDFYDYFQKPNVDEYDKFDVYLQLDNCDIEEYFNSFDDIMYGPKQYVKD